MDNAKFEIGLVAAVVAAILAAVAYAALSSPAARQPTAQRVGTLGAVVAQVNEENCMLRHQDGDMDKCMMSAPIQF